MKSKLAILGANGHGKVAANIAEKLGLWNKIVFFDDDSSIEKSLDFPVIGNINEAMNYINAYEFFIGIGDNVARKKIQEELLVKKADIATLIDVSAEVGKNVSIERGVIIMPGAIINCDSHISEGCIVNTGATLDHDTIIGRYSHLSPGVNVAGNVRVGELNWIGINATIINNISLASKITVGAGAVVVNDLNTSGVYIGVPAHLLSKHNES